MKRKNKNVPAIPVGLELINESQEALEAWSKLGDVQRIFFTAWIRNGYKAAEAYTKAYKIQDLKIASRAGHQMLRGKNIKIIRQAMYEATLDEIPFERLDYVEYEALEDEDPNVRLKAAKQIRQRIEKLNPQKKDGEGMNNQFNFFGEGFEDLLAPIKDIINGGDRYRKDNEIRLPNTKKDT